MDPRREVLGEFLGEFFGDPFGVPLGDPEITGSFIVKGILAENC